MPNIKGAAKRMRQAAKARQRNVAAKGKIKSVRRALLDVQAGPAVAESAKTYQEYCSLLDKAAKRGIIKKNTAVRRKRRAANRLRALATAPAAQA